VKKIKKAPLDRVRKAFAAGAAVDETAARLAQPGVKLKPRRPKKTYGMARNTVARARAIEMRVWDMIAQGRTTSGIARELGMANSTVLQIIRRVEQRCAQICVASAMEMKARQVRMLERSADEAFEAWQRSKSPSRKVQKEVASGGDSEESEVVRTTVEEQVGDPRYLAEMRAALADIRDLYGLNVPKQVDLTSGSGTVVEVMWGDGKPSGAATGPLIEAQSHTAVVEGGEKTTSDENLHTDLHCEEGIEDLETVAELEAQLLPADMAQRLAARRASGSAREGD
jgi:hypothetical protein